MTLLEKTNQIGEKKRYISKIKKVNIVIITVLFTILFFTIIELITKMIKGNITIEDVERTLIISISIFIGIDLIRQLYKLAKEEVYNIEDIESKIEIAKKYHLKDYEFVEIINVDDKNSVLRYYAMPILDEEAISIKIIKKAENFEFEDVVNNFFFFLAIYKPKN